MSAARRGQSFHRQAFALVLALFMVGLLATSGAGLALLAATESIRSGASAHDLDHQLAVRSLLVALPGLLNRAEVATLPSAESSNVRQLSVQMGSCEVTCHVVPENGKLRLGDARRGTDRLAPLRNLATQQGLAADHVRVLPIVQGADTQGWPAFMWFDQIVDAETPDEVFHWFHKESPMNPAQGGTHRSWSDLVSFWPSDGAQFHSLVVQTRIGSDRRRWYVVASLNEDHVNVHYLGRI